MSRPYLCPFLGREIVSHETLTMRCRRCNQQLPRSTFRLMRGRYPSSWCPACHVAATREWRARNRDEINTRRRAAYRAAHPRPPAPQPDSARDCRAKVSGAP